MPFNTRMFALIISYALFLNCFVIQFSHNLEKGDTTTGILPQWVAHGSLCPSQRWKSSLPSSQHSLLRSTEGMAQGREGGRRFRFLFKIVKPLWGRGGGGGEWVGPPDPSRGRGRGTLGPFGCLGEGEGWAGEEVGRGGGGRTEWLSLCRPMRASLVCMLMWGCWGEDGRGNEVDRSS